MKAENQIGTKFLNVLGEPLKICSCEPMTGWYRDGFCKSDSSDIGQHSICCIMSEAFLNYSKAQGNDLITPQKEFGFPGLKDGDHWCICARRWKEAYEDGMAPLVCLESTERSTLKVIEIEILKEHAYHKKRNQVN